MSKYKNISSILKKGYGQKSSNRDSWTFIGNVNENTLPIGYIVDSSGNYVKYDYDTWEIRNKEKNYHNDMIRDGWTPVGYKLQQNAEFQLPIGTIIDPTRKYIKQDYETWDLIRKEQEEKQRPIAEANLKKALEEIEMIKIIDEYINKLRDQKRKKQKAITKKEKEMRGKRILTLEKEIKKYKQKIERHKRRKIRK